MRGFGRLKKFKIFPILFVTVLATLIFVAALLLPSPAYANSAQKYFEGVDATGALMRGDSPIVVESETLTFDIDEFPQNYYDTQEKFLTYGGKVTAQYTFFNPSEYTVTSKLCFPFGKSPSYAPAWPFFDDDTTNIEDKYPSVYNVAVDGEKIDAKLRHTFSAPYTPFDVERDMEKIVDDYMEDDFYTPDLPVIKYTYTVDYFQNTQSDFNVYAAFDIANIDGSPRVYFPEMMSVNHQNGVYRVGTCVENDKTVHIYVFGGISSGDKPKWKFYANLGLKSEDEISGRMIEQKAETMTFEEFALEGRAENSNVSKTDWYNAVLTQLVEERAQSDRPAVKLEGYADTLEKNLMRWYEYTLTFAPNERVVNSVTAPVYPTVMDNFDPPKYCYTYLLSPAKTWSEFGRLDIKINTPYFLLDGPSFADGFQKTEDGFALSLDGLPDGELTFTLCASEAPEEERGTFLWVFIALILWSLNIFSMLIPDIGIASDVLAALLIARPLLDLAGGVVTLIILGIRRAIKKIRAKNAPPAILIEATDETDDPNDASDMPEIANISRETSEDDGSTSVDDESD